MSAVSQDPPGFTDSERYTGRKRSVKMVEEYLISGGSSKIKILIDEGELEKLYFVSEPQISDKEQERLGRVVDEVERMIPLITEGNELKSLKDLEEAVEEYLSSRHRSAGKEFAEKVRHIIHKKNVGFGDLHAMVLDPDVEDISCNGPGMPVYVYHRRYGSLKSNVSYRSEVELSSALVKMAQLCGKEVSVSNPVLDGITPSGHRIQGLYGKEVSPKGSAFTIRLFREKPFTPIEMVRSGAASPEMVAYMWYMVEYLQSGLVVGPPAVGKTSTLNAILMLIPPNTKVFSIEETREINILHPNWVAASTRETGSSSSKVTGREGKIDMFELVKMAMRQRPTYLVVGEVRGKEAYTLFQAMSTGHTTYSTMHADSMSTMLNRLESEPLSIPRLLVSYLRTVIIGRFIRRNLETVRRITELNEVVGVDSNTNEIIYNRVFSYDSSTDKHSYSGYSALLRKIASSRNIGEEELMEEFRERTSIIGYMAGMENADYREISRIINQYYFNREELRRSITEGSNGESHD